MTDHSHFEELAALEAGGFLSAEELVELREHIKDCAECGKAEQEFGQLVQFGLPLTVSPVREFVDEMKTRPEPDTRALFLQRARLEGIGFSSEVEKSARPQGRRVGYIVGTAVALAAAIVLAILYGPYHLPASREALQAKQQADQLKRENLALAATLNQLNESLAAQHREVENLHAQLGNVSKTQNQPGKDGQSASREAQLLEESHNREELLAEARDEAAHANQLRANDQASLAAQLARITDLSNKLRVASATLDMERQLAAAGKDVRELMLARQLHVIDVRDTDPNGNPGKAFGRVFLTEGKSLTFYAFDLNEDQDVNAKRSFQVWAVPDTNKNSSQSLGFLHADAKAQGRWVLKVENAAMLKDINSVFVTVEPVAGGKQPSGQKMLYAYLGEANHR
jgi:hypothetical protein